VETIRLLNFRYYWLQATPTATSLMLPIGINQSMTISNVDPTYISNNCDQFWGASGANILHSDSRFALDYTINPNLGVTVHAVPLKDANETICTWDRWLPRWWFMSCSCENF